MVPKKSLAGLAPMGRDRRTLPRYSFTATAEALDPQSRGRMSARTSDISRGGCYVDTFCPFPRNAKLKIRIVRDKENVVADAKVAYSQVGMGMGLSFTSVEAAHQQVLDRWIGELSGETPVMFSDLPPQEAIVAQTSPQPMLVPQKAPQQILTRQIAANDPALVLAELIIALLGRGALEAAEGDALLHRLLKAVPRT